MIEVKNLFKSFNDQHVLNDICCRFEDGKNNLIIGRSGSGKTVLLKCLIMLHKPERGEIEYDGRPLLQLSRKELIKLRQEIGVLFQASALFDSMTVAENVEYPMRMFGSMTAIEREKRMKYCLERVNLPNALEKYPSELSGGMQKRVAIARAISLNPKYLFCDEPNSGLDPQTSLVIDKLIDDITKEYDITTVVNTHDMNSVLGIGDNITFLYQGHVEWVGSKDNILQNNNDALQEFLFSNPILQAVRK